MVRTIRNIVLIFCAASFIAGCGVVFMHNPEKARVTADNFFAYLYKIKDYPTAYGMTNKFFRQNFKDGYLEDLEGSLEKKYGRFQGIRPDSFFYEGGSRDIEIFYTVIFNNGITYQKIALSDDGKGGYNVSSVVYGDKPFTGYRLMRKFKE